MPIFQIELEDGRKFEVDAADQASAIGGLQQQLGQQQPEQPKFGYFGDYQQMRREAQQSMAEGAAAAMNAGAGIKDRLLGAGQAALGGAAYVASPINAAYRTVVGKPVEHLTGVPKEYTEFAAQLATPGIGMTRLSTFSRSPKAVPTAEQLKDAYKTAKASPDVAAVQIKPQATEKVSAVIAAELNKDWLDPNLAPKTFHILNKLTKAPDDAVVTMANVDSARRLLGKLAGRGDEEAAAAVIAKGKLDDWMGKVGPGDVLAGDPALAQQIMTEGRANYSRYKAASALDKKIAMAEEQSATTNSGLNLTNKLREKVRQFLNSDDARMLSKDEITKLEKFRDGSNSANVLRYASNFLGGGGGLGALSAGGLSGAVGWQMGGPVGAALMAVPTTAAGLGLRVLSNRLASRDVSKLSELLRSNSPLGRQMKASVESWFKYADVAEKKPMTPRVLSMLLLQSRNLSNNLKDAGIVVSPEALAGIASEKPNKD